MIKGFIIQNVLLICILEMSISIDLKNDKTDSKPDELEIPVTWTLKRLFLYTVRHIFSPKRITLLVLLCLNSFKWGVSSFLTIRQHFTFLSLILRLIPIFQIAFTYKSCNSFTKMFGLKLKYSMHIMHILCILGIFYANYTLFGIFYAYFK